MINFIFLIQVLHARASPHRRLPAKILLVSWKPKSLGIVTGTLVRGHKEPEGPGYRDLKSEINKPTSKCCFQGRKRKGTFLNPKVSPREACIFTILPPG